MAEHTAPETDAAVILVADDEPMIREFVTTLLQAQGYTVLAVETGEEALAVARERSGRIDLIVTDVMMPEMSGPEIVERIHERHPDIPVLFLTGYPRDVIRDRGLVGPDGELLEKPFENAAFREKVDALLNRQIGG